MAKRFPYARMKSQDVLLELSLFMHAQKRPVSGWLDRLQDFFGKELHQQHKLFGRERGEVKLSSWALLSLIWCVYVSVFNSSNREGKCVCACLRTAGTFIPFLGGGRVGGIGGTERQVKHDRAWSPHRRVIVTCTALRPPRYFIICVCVCVCVGVWV